MQRLGSLKDIVQDKINSISTKCTSNCNSMKKNELKTDESTSTSTVSASVEWHNFNIKELLALSKQNQWTDVHKDITSLLLSLSKYNTLKSATPHLPKDASHEEDDVKMANETDDVDNENVIATLKSELECDICLDFYVEPLTLSCGHTFCRLCIISMQSKCDKKCPLCKTCSHIDPCMHPQNIVISNSVKSIFAKQQYMERLAALDKVKADLKRNIPVFVMNMVRYPGMAMHLHLFEPRYLHMINRAISSGNRFAYLCSTMNDNGNGYRPYEQDIATLVKIEECQFLPDGRCLLQGVIERRIHVNSCWVEKGTQGLWYVKYSDFMDDDGVDDDGQNDDEDEDELDADHVELIEKFVCYIYGKSNHVIKSIENECGHRVHLSDNNREQWSFWIVALIYIAKRNDSQANWIKHAMHTRNTMDRIKSCYDILKPQEHIWSPNVNETTGTKQE